MCLLAHFRKLYTHSILSVPPPSFCAPGEVFACARSSAIRWPPLILALPRPFFFCVHSHGQLSSYTYDQLKRLTAATATVNGSQVWQQTYSYDGFGNLNNRSGAGGNFNVNIDGNSNRIFGGTFCVDPAGHMTSDTGAICQQYTYDLENRMVAAQVPSSPTVAYGYDPQNKYVNSGVGFPYTVYGIDGRKIGTYSTQTVYHPAGYTLVFLKASENVYFGGKLVSGIGPSGNSSSATATGPSGLGARQRKQPVQLLPLRRRIHPDPQRPRKLRHLLPRCLHRSRLRRPALVQLYVCQVHERGPARQKRPIR